MAVNERTLLILAALGACVVAYAVHALMTRAAVDEHPAPARTVGAAASDPDADRGQAEAQVPKPRLPRINPAGGTRKREQPSGGPPPPVPMPEVTLEEAREDYDDFMAELERELQRNRDTGKPLPNEDWVEYYRRGHEIMDPLRRYMSSGTEDERKEIGELDEALRTVMSKLQRDPADLEEDAAQ